MESHEGLSRTQDKSIRGGTVRIWSIQPESLYEQLKVEKVLHCNPAFTDEDFRQAYDWLTRQMAVCIGSPPEGVLYPFWAWHTIDGLHQKPDLRRSEYKAYNDNPVCLELEIPDNKVLLSDFDGWHMVLNNLYYLDYIDEEKADLEDAWLDSLPPGEQTSVKMKSWEKIFDVYLPNKDSGDDEGLYIQATFWELRLDQVVSLRHFKGRLCGSCEMSIDL
jgi:hypothetical protein